MNDSFKGPRISAATYFLDAQKVCKKAPGTHVPRSLLHISSHPCSESE